MIVQIIADAPATDLDLVDHLLPIIALDGAIYRLLETGIVPSFLIGDLDAADAAVQEKARRLGTRVIHEHDQDSNDLEKGIHLAIKLGATEIRIFQALGGRMDHTLHNLGLLKKFYPNKISIINYSETITYHEDSSVNLYGKVGLPVAIMGFPEAKVTSKGLKYDMDELTLKIGSKQSSSNELGEGIADVQIVGAAVLILDNKVSISASSCLSALSC